MNLQPVILCGGSGTRLWPLSREQYPKEMPVLASEGTLLQATARRVDKLLTAAGQKVLSRPSEAGSLVQQGCRR